MSDVTIGKPIHISKIRRVLRDNSTTTVNLSNSPNINKWAKYKPVPVPRDILFPSHDIAHKKPYSTGFDKTIIAEDNVNSMIEAYDRYEYRRSVGRGNFSLFDGYYHNAVPPCVVTFPNELIIDDMAKTVRLFDADQLLYDYNITLNDVVNDLNINREEWRLAVVMHDARNNIIHFWVSSEDASYITSDGTNDANQVYVNVTNVQGISEGAEVYIIMMLLKTTLGDNDYHYGYSPDQLPVGTSSTPVCIALPINVGIDGENYKGKPLIKKAEGGGALGGKITNIYFSAHCTDSERHQLVPNSWNSYYNRFDIKEIQLFTYSSKMGIDEFNMWIEGVVSVEVTFEYGYGFSKDGDKSSVNWNDYGSHTAIVFSEAIKNLQLDYDETTSEFKDVRLLMTLDQDALNLDNMFLDYGDYDIYNITLRFYCTKYGTQTPLLVKSVDMPYKATGINDIIYEENNE